VNPNAQSFEAAVIDILVPYRRIAKKKFVKFRALALTKLTMWIQSFIVSDNSFGKTLIIRDSLRSVAMGGIASKTLLCPYKIILNKQ